MLPLFSAPTTTVDPLTATEKLKKSSAAPSLGVSFCVRTCFWVEQIFLNAVQNVFGNGSLPAVPTRQYNYLRGVFADTTFVYGDTPAVLNALIR